MVQLFHFISEVLLNHMFSQLYSLTFSVQQVTLDLQDTPVTLDIVDILDTLVIQV